MNKNFPSQKRNPAPTSTRSRALSHARTHNPRLRQLLISSFFLLAIVANARTQDYVGKDLYIVAAPAGFAAPISSGQEAIALGQYSGTAFDGITTHALVWLPPTGEVVDLQPVGFSASGANATDGHQQVGALFVLGNVQHAGLWTGTPESALDLHPTILAGFDTSLAFGVGGGQQVGSGMGPATANDAHALLWNGSAASAVDLHPVGLGLTSSVAYGADGAQQVGSAQTGSVTHALLWSGTAGSVIDLHNAFVGQSFSTSVAYGLGGGQQVGYLSNGPLTETHAAVWSGTAASAVDLRPSDAKTAVAYATDGHIQVGYTTSLLPTFFFHARLWKGTADSAVDLNDLLPTYLTNSRAYSIDAAGNIYGLAYESDGTLHAVEWLTQAANLANISTRAYVGAEDNVLIAGFIVNGTQDKPILIRGIGTSLGLPPVNLPSVLEDPTLELHDSAGTIIGSNDNWKDTQQDAIEATGLAPTEDAEAAILATLAPGAYTVILRGANGTVGDGLVDFYDLDTSLDSRLPNISSRGLVQTGDDVMIGGFIVGGAEDGTVLLRAIGPSLTQFGVSNALSDPTLELHDGTGALIASDDNWKETQQAAIAATGLAPADNKESAILATLAPGSYTAIVRGASNTTGVALVEAYQLAPAP